MRLERQESLTAPALRKKVGGRALVLVVDDSEEAQTIVAAALARDRFELVGARDGKEALEMMDRGAVPDLVLLDLMMPRMNGWQVLGEMRKTAALANVPVVVLTAFGERADLPPGCAVLHKPVDAIVLRDRVRVLLSTPRNKEIAPWSDG